MMLTVTDPFEALAQPITKAPPKPPYASPIQSRKGWIVATVIFLLVVVGGLIWNRFGTAGTASQAKLDQAKSSCEQFYDQRAGETGTYTNEQASGTRDVQQVTGHATFPDGSSADYTCLIKLTDHDALVNLESLTIANLIPAG